MDHLRHKQRHEPISLLHVFKELLGMAPVHSSDNLINRWWVWGNCKGDAWRFWKSWFNLLQCSVVLQFDLIQHDYRILWSICSSCTFQWGPSIQVVQHYYDRATSSFTTSHNLLNLQLCENDDVVWRWQARGTCIRLGRKMSQWSSSW